jgi:hypothetical protein
MRVFYFVQNYKIWIWWGRALGNGGYGDAGGQENLARFPPSADELSSKTEFVQRIPCGGVAWERNAGSFDCALLRFAHSASLRMTNLGWVSIVVVVPVVWGLEVEDQIAGCG